MANVLILEDDNFLNEEIKFHLEDEGHHCEIIDNADSLMDNLKILENYKLLVLDLMMMRGENLKDMKSDFATGELIFRRIKETYPKLEIVILTAVSNSDIKLTKKELNDIPIFIKPLDSESIKDFLNIINERTKK